MCGSPKMSPVIQPKYKRKNSDKRKERSRDAARDRRAKETQLFQELESLLPISGVPGNSQLSMDKTSLIRLTLANLKCRDLVEKGFMFPGVKEEGFGVMSTNEMLSSMDSFCIVISEDMEVIFISNNVESHIGLNALELMGESFFDYIHPCDHHQLKALLSLEGGQTKEAYVRIKVTVTERGRMINLRQANYKVLKISGIVRKLHDSEYGGMAGNVFLGVSQLIGRDKMAQNMDNFPLSGFFQTKHSSDMKFMETDLWLSTVGQYPSGYLEGISFYEFIHIEDSPQVQRALKNLCEQGQCETAPYRFLVAGGGWVWIQTRANLAQVRKGSTKGNTIICTHTAISEVMNREDLLALVQIIPENRNIRKKQKIEKIEPFEKFTFIREPKPFDEIYKILQMPDAKPFEETSNVLQMLEEQPIMLPMSCQEENYSSLPNSNSKDHMYFYPTYTTPSVIVEPKKPEPQFSTESIITRSTVIVSPRSTIPIAVPAQVAPIESNSNSPNVMTSALFVLSKESDEGSIDHASEPSIINENQDETEDADNEIDDEGVFSLFNAEFFLDGCYDLEQLSPSSSDSVKIEENQSRNYVNEEQIPLFEFCDESLGQKQKDKESQNPIPSFDFCDESLVQKQQDNESQNPIDNSEEFFKILDETMPPKENNPVNYRQKENLFAMDDNKVIWHFEKGNLETETCFSQFQKEFNMPPAAPTLSYNTGDYFNYDPCQGKMNTVNQMWNSVVENPATQKPINHPKMWKNTADPKLRNPSKMWANATEQTWKRKRSPTPEDAYLVKKTMSNITPEFPELQKFFKGQYTKNHYDNIIKKNLSEIPKQTRLPHYHVNIETNPKRITPIPYHKNVMKNLKRPTTLHCEKKGETNPMQIPKRMGMEYHVNLDPRNVFQFPNN